MLTATLPAVTAPPDLARGRTWLLLALLTAVPLVLRAVFAAHVELSPDEAYYASWAARLDASYFDHPPLVAWLISAGTSIFGQNELGVRAGGLVMGAALPWLLYGAARSIGASRRASTWSAALASSTLLLSAGAVIVTPDTPLCLAFAVAVYCVARASRAGAARVGSTVGAGLALAAAFASKLTTALFFAAAVVLTGLGPSRRRAAWLALSLVGLAPMLWWNVRHDWPMFTFHAARVADRAAFTPHYAAEFLGAQVALLCIGPAVLAGAAAWWALRRGAPVVRALAWWGLLPLAATCALAMFTKVEANWIAPTFLPLFVVLAAWLDSRAPLRLRARTLALVGGVAALLTIVAHVHVAMPFLPLPPHRDPSSQLRGWRTLAAAVAAERSGLPVLTSRYQEAALLAFYLRDASITTLPHGKRKSQFDLWPTPTRTAARALCVHLDGEAPPWGKRFDLPPTVYFLHVCTPEHWRAP